ncbi:APC family permease [Hellea balneolensis]|uniref:APC family permease n=1 Tax=Hellea balneolensis TaxID=287478 RepID=UPI000413C48C|nr:amino acid permease [Hellea balneolensis]
MKSFYSPHTATAVIVANMVGTGVFTSLGFQLVDIQSVFAIMMLWIVGGIASLCGAATYAELGAALPRSGGEYNFLGRIYHPMAGFISGWVSAVIGFAAPIAAVSLAFGTYSTAALPGDYAPWIAKALACALVILVTLVHGRNRQASGGFQYGFTAIKVILILAFCLSAFIFTSNPQPISPLPQAGDWDIITSAAFGVSLIYVAYAYTGWNAAVYISGELENPQRDLPRILIFGTGLVMALYVLLNYVFLYAAPMEAMEGQVEIGYIAAKGIFGETGARIAGGMLSLLLISTVSAMTLAGPRALQAIGEDFKALKFLGKVNKDGIPRNAIYFQSAIALIYIVTSSFKAIVVFAGAMLALNSFLAILGVFVLRYREPDLPRPYKTWGYPVVPLVYLAITAFMLAFVVINEPDKALGGLGIILMGVVFYVVSARLNRS